VSSSASPVTLITGARKGIGRFLAHHYVKLGHQVIGCSRQKPEWSLDGYEHVQLDVGDEIAVTELLSHVQRRYDGLDNLINNAGVASMNHCLLTPGKTVFQLLHTNYIGTFLFSREAAKLMKRRRCGRIVNFSSVAHPMKLAGEAVYASAKAAVESLSAIMAFELASYGITVNVVGPTPIDTDLTRTVPPDKMERLLARQAIRRYGTFDEVANVVDFFLSTKSSFITGQRIYLGGV
jgi:3-oxoacyl-[acyl-carrier protein] reductase